MLFYSKVNEKYNDMTHAQKTVANYVGEHPDDVAFCTLEALAAKINVSTTTVIRFARAMGYSGFSDMQDEVKREMQIKSTLPERLDNLVSNRSGGEDLTLQSCFATDMDNLHQTLNGLDPQELKKAVDLISGANRIYILGMRSSFSLAHYLTSRLGEIKRNVSFVQSTGMIYPEEVVSAGEGDVCIAYVFPRYSKTALNILAWMRSYGVKVILFTSMSDLPIKSYGDVCFNCAINSISCKNSLTAPMCLTNYLVAELANQNYDEAHDVLSRTEELLSTGFYLGI